VIDGVRVSVGVGVLVDASVAFGLLVMLTVATGDRIMVSGVASGLHAVSAQALRKMAVARSKNVMTATLTLR
jgi:hypothetical protein